MANTNVVVEVRKKISATHVFIGSNDDDDDGSDETMLWLCSIHTQCLYICSVVAITFVISDAY